jgi:GT2 family glycosyltransferase
MRLVTLPEPHDPQVSVVILAWRQTDRLLDCLAALAESEGAPAFETVIVLNGAAPEVRELVAHGVAGARIVDVEANVGFGGGCNRGVAAAHGSLVLFLNDDAVVEPTMLAALCARVLGDETVAAAAAVLLNPDGSLQEAGSRVLADAGTVQLGAGLDPESPEAVALLTVRDIDYGSGAALLVRKSAFDEVGGFDPVYEPAYFEDVDLAFRFKARGLRVVLEPAARATHATGSSTSTDTRFRSYASDHAGTVFLDRWRTTLQTAPERDASPGALCVVSPADSPVTDTSVRTPAEASASITAGYVRWLSDQLDARETRLAVLEAEGAELRAKQAELYETAHELRTRLDDLESRGPMGIVKWQLGVAKNRLSAK